LNSELLKPIFNDIKDIYFALHKEKSLHGGKKNYDNMVVNYFYDISKVLDNLSFMLKQNSVVYWVVGDSAPYGVYLPVDYFTGKLALAHGFLDFDFTKVRDRNDKWKNRKHNVPLKEGILKISK
jgi:hypothetical protein